MSIKQYPLIRWEQGSDFHCCDFKPEEAKTAAPWSDVPSSLFGSGRDALRALQLHGATKLGCKRVYIPSFFCQEVALSMHVGGLELRSYKDAPGETPNWPDDIGNCDCVLVVNFFGLRERADTEQLVESGALIVEDHTHDPWSKWACSSNADYCVVSLRKTLPLPEGGVLWSPRGHSLPPEPPVTKQRQLAADAKRAGMLLKRLYLAGHEVAKDDFRSLLMEGEEEIAKGEISGMTRATRALLNCLPVDRWRTKRLQNFHMLVSQLDGTSGIRILRPENQRCVPFSLILLTDTLELREHLRVGLIAKNIYPAVLWSLENPVYEVPIDHVNLSRRILAIHCDARNNEKDMIKVADNVISLLCSK